MDFITNLMLPKKRRIPRKEFAHVFLGGKRINSPGLLLCVAPLNSGKKEEASRFSFSVSKKVYPRAVDRNKYRRRGYSVVSENTNQIKPGHYFLFSFKKTPNPPSFHELEGEIRGLLSRSGMLI